MKRTAVWVSLLGVLVAGAVPLGVQAASAPAPTAPTPASKAPASVKPLTVVGQVKSASADTLVVLVGKAKKEETFVLDSATKISKTGKTIAATDLTTTDQVRVSYAETDGKMMAKAVSVRTAKTAAKPTTPAQPASQVKAP